MNVQGAVAIVTGGASGLGLASAKRLAAAGAKVMIVDLATSPGAAVAAELGGGFAVADVADEASMTAAIASAEAMGPVRVLVPMVTAREEVEAVKMRMRALAKRLRGDGVAIAEHVAFGVMVEVPAAALTLADYADLIDFAAVGTNDLVQYLLAADRTHEALAGLYSERHPAVLRLLHRLFTQAREIGLPIHVCGELAASALDVPLLLALGLRDFSVHPGALLEVREAIRAVDLKRLKRRTSSLLKCRERADVERWLQRVAAVTN